MPGAGVIFSVIWRRTAGFLLFAILLFFSRHVFSPESRAFISISRSALLTFTSLAPMVFRTITCYGVFCRHCGTRSSGSLIYKKRAPRRPPCTSSVFLWASGSGLMAVTAGRITTTFSGTYKGSSISIRICGPLTLTDGIGVLRRSAEGRPRCGVFILRAVSIFGTDGVTSLVPYIRRIGSRLIDVF